MKISQPILRYHGGKWRIAPWVIRHLPAHEVYVEPFGGGASVLLRKTPSRGEVYNDIDGDIVNVFRVLRDKKKSKRLADICALTPYARTELELACEMETDDPVEQARRTLYRAWASFGSAGATRGRTGFRTFTSPGHRYTPVATIWARLPDQIYTFISRLRSVIIENRPALDVMRQHDDVKTLHYIDPPYLPETRSFDGGRYYRHEMTGEQHSELLDFLQTLKGAVVVSGYPSDLYSCKLSGWKMIQCKTNGSSRFGSVERTECLWIKPGTDVRFRQLFLF